MPYAFTSDLSMGRKIRDFFHQESSSGALCPYNKVASLPKREDEEESVKLSTPGIV